MIFNRRPFKVLDAKLIDILNRLNAANVHAIQLYCESRCNVTKFIQIIMQIGKWQVSLLFKCVQRLLTVLHLYKRPSVHNTKK